MPRRWGLLLLGLLQLLKWLQEPCPAGLGQAAAPCPATMSEVQACLQEWGRAWGLAPHAAVALYAVAAQALGCCLSLPHPSGSFLPHHITCRDLCSLPPGGPQVPRDEKEPWSAA